MEREERTRRREEEEDGRRKRKRETMWTKEREVGETSKETGGGEGGGVYSRSVHDMDIEKP